MTLALFDLDNTLINGDSDHSWGIYLGEIGVLDAREQQQKQDEFYAQYQSGSLDIMEFLQFQLSPLAQHPLEQLLKWRDDYINQVVKPMLDTGKPELVEKHRKLGHELLIITATSDFITRPIADMLNVKTLIATTAEVKDGNYTGGVSGTPCYQGGKVTRLNDWMAANNKNLDNSWFYSDSYNDLPLLELCAHPIAVTPDQRLRQHAEQSNWPIID